MTQKKDIAAEATSWIGTPFTHQGRMKGVGVDCIGLIVGVCKELDLKSDVRDQTNGRVLSLHEFDTPNYSRLPNRQALKENLERFCEPIPMENLNVGDIILFRMEHWPQHVGIVTEKTAEDLFFVHATEPVKKVTLCRYDARWKKLTVGTFQFHKSAFEEGDV